MIEAHRVSGKLNWDVKLNELDKFIGLVIARGILGQRGFASGKFVGYNVWVSNVQQNCIKTQVQGYNTLSTFRCEK